jgi:hypothetical protein
MAALLSLAGLQVHSDVRNKEGKMMVIKSKDSYCGKSTRDERICAGEQ